MSWVLGYIGEQVPTDVQKKIASFHPNPLYQFQSPTLYLAAGGIPQTCLSVNINSLDQSIRRGALIVGLGIRKGDRTCKFLDSGDWQKILEPRIPDFSILDGHFLALRWDGDRVEFFSDQLGMRTIYFVSTDGGVVFSTRLEWVTKFRNDHELDFNEFGSQWLTFNHLSYESFIKGINRLGPGGVAHCTPSRIAIKNKPFEFHHVNQPVSIEDTLTAFLNPLLDQGSTLSLGLSGGLDSRLLFNLLTSGAQSRFVLHLFGNPNEPDVTIVQRIASEYRVDQIFFPESVEMEEPNPDFMKEYVAKTSLALPVSSWTKLQFYSRLHQMKKIMIDGGMGEIGRRQFLNRLYFSASRKKISDNPTTIGRYIRMHHASIFSPDVEKSMEEGIDAQIRDAWSSMPPIENVELENLIDLFIVRFRFPNYAGLDQSRLDEEIVNYMPFAQPSFIRAVLQMSVHQRRNGRYYRQLIRGRKPSLTKYPLVKGNVSFPFALPTLPGWLYTKMKTKAGFSFFNPTRDNFLHSLKEYVYDITSSERVKSFGAYDYDNIIKLVNRYYSGDNRLGSELDWFLTFELWRQSMGIS